MDEKGIAEMAKKGLNDDGYEKYKWEEWGQMNDELSSAIERAEKSGDWDGVQEMAENMKEWRETKK